MIGLGVLNYLNTTVAGLWGRRRELAMMEAIGITRKQLRKMLIWEGIYYSAIIAGLLITVGSVTLYGIFEVVHSRLKYAKFYFPSGALVCILIIMFLGCVGIPLYLYRKTVKESVVERLRKSNE